ncbi:MAG: glycosyltransferase [Ferruginibacter sp.]
MSNLKVTSAKMNVKGKFLFCGNEKFYIKGVTYGTFAPGPDGCQFPDILTVENDFRALAASGLNCIRTYTVPPIYVLDIADSLNLKVMVGLPWEQHITFLDSSERKHNIIKSIKEAVLSCEGHNAVLCYTIGNEIPAPIVRWYGKSKTEKFLKQLYDAVKSVAPDSLVTYVNYPTTEYLELDFLDFSCYNVYLETPEKLGKYIARLHNLCGDRPLVLAEIGLDSLRNGDEKQAETLVWQTETIFGKGCAGMFIFAWTDEWWRGGFEIEDWDFGLVDRERNPKPALEAVAGAMAEVPFAAGNYQPFFSVVVCSYNGSATIRDTLNALTNLSYPRFEVIVVNDGSTDDLAEIVSHYPVRLITTPNKGLSNARNTGMYNAKGEIIAYIDDDAYPEEHWLHYLAYAYSNSEHGAMGGPNIIPEEDGPLAFCVANAPGGPVHVLSTDEIAEHIPGCNLSVRKNVLMKIGGFDPVYRAAGDDVDICWRIQEAGHTIGFHPSAVVWHHRRNSLKAYWKQQKGYGKAEALLEAKWPEKYNGFGHLTWAGRIYGNGITLPVKVKKDKVFHGTWGSALFQSVYQPAEGFLNSIPLMPEWYLLTVLTAVLSALGFLWTPLLFLWPLCVITVLLVIIQAVISSGKSSSLRPETPGHFKYRMLIIVLHIIQPIARLYGRFQHGITPWRSRGAGLHSKFLIMFGCRMFTHWSEEWRSSEEWLADVEKKLMALKTRVKRGGNFDNWDIQVRNGLFSKSRGLLTIEEHGAGKQFLRFKCCAHYSFYGFLMIAIPCGLAVAAALDRSFLVSGILAFITAVMAFRFITETAGSMTSLYTRFKLLAITEQEEAGKVVRKERINADLNESIHQNLFMKPVIKPLNMGNFHAEVQVTE